ncbi:TIGR04211 family SH3 domain-containing protein [Alteromonas sp. W364]|jgi:SH3 domain protein|uniref:TIGR04211 family SH3 domain-containing protein n=1 Tax=Alteromonas sp. W364 TaxID=3075610 RepID=UPI0028880179|nr:TIGR04211 family SH3 domain-containing protein [Alteromonas sp. W364]MDT0627363.1 TIGR04211 family SH3 domain-containing protein [Alteromonas sp. W364]
MQVNLAFLTVVFLLLSPLSSAQETEQETDAPREVRYISDELFIYLHAGPGRDFRILGSITAGTTVSLLEVDSSAGYAQIEDDRGRTGWVESKFVSRIPSIRAELTQARERVAEQQIEVDEALNAMRKAKRDRQDAEKQRLSLNRSLTKSLEEKAELARVIDRKDRNDQMRWFTRGTVLALVSVLFGFLLGLYARKRGKSNPLL